MNRIELIKEAALKVKARKENTTVEELKFQESIVKLDARKVQIKAEEKARRKEERKIAKDLSGQVKKAGHLKSGNLDFNRPENMYYSDKDNAKFLEGSSIMDAYNANRSADGDY